MCLLNANAQFISKYSRPLARDFTSEAGIFRFATNKTVSSYAPHFCDIVFCATDRLLRFRIDVVDIWIWAHILTNSQCTTIYFDRHDFMQLIEHNQNYYRQELKSHCGSLLPFPTNSIWFPFTKAHCVLLMWIYLVFDSILCSPNDWNWRQSNLIQLFCSSARQSSILLHIWFYSRKFRLFLFPYCVLTNAKRHSSDSTGNGIESSNHSWCSASNFMSFIWLIFSQV